MGFKVIASGRKTGTQSIAKDVATIELSSNDFIFSQASIVTSAMVEPNSYKIHPSTARFINNNGDGWTNEALKNNYDSFIGAYNFVNHVQEHDKAVGFVGDAISRRIIIDPEDNIYVRYIEILIATSRDFQTLVNKILKDDIKYLSMGCEAETSQCSYCGEVFEDEELCDHLAYSKGKYYIDKQVEVFNREQENK